MADGFTRIAPDALAGAFTPTVLIAALDAARREAEAMPPPLPAGPDPASIAAVAISSKAAAGAASTTTSQAASSALVTTIGGTLKPPT
uniref:hypothetical protein n=1 Tax=Neoroseomonas rubea TaxID=2748666 RepID=UPI0018DF62F6